MGREGELELSEKVNLDDFHFGIRERRTSSKGDFRTTLVVQLQQISEFVDLDDYKIEIQDGAEIVKVRLCLSAAGKEKSTTLDLVIKDMCSDMIDDSRCNVECLTKASIWGIIPISPVFNTCWMGSLFKHILSKGPEALESMAQEVIQDGYFVQSFMALAYAVLLRVREPFEFARNIYNGNLNPHEAFDLEAFFKRSLPSIEPVLRYFSGKDVSTISTASLNASKAKVDAAVKKYLKHYDNVLGCSGGHDVTTMQDRIRDTGWMYMVCSELYNMCSAAAEVLILKPVVLQELIRVSNEEFDGAVAGGTVFVTSFAVFLQGVANLVRNGLSNNSGEAYAILLISCGTAAVSAVWTWVGYRKAKALQKEHAQYQDDFGAIRNSWEEVYKMLLVCEYHYSEGDQSSQTLVLSNPDVERAGQEYREATRHQNGSISKEQSISIWMIEKFDSLQDWRQKLG